MFLSDGDYLMTETSNFLVELTKSLSFRPPACWKASYTHYDPVDQHVIDVW